ncbi:MAG: hypothetical protein Tsb0017_06430 [Geothermobacteraceae bacterium]
MTVSLSCFAVGPPDYLPNGPHPRIWIDSNWLADLNGKQAAGDPEWTALERWCDTYLGTTGYDQGDVGWQGYRGSGYNKFIMNFLVAYMVLKDDNPAKAATYGAYLHDLVYKGIYQGLSAGDEYNGLAVLRSGESTDRTINQAEATALGISYSTTKLGYGARNMACAVVAYDWLHGEGIFTAQELSDLAGMFYRWFDWIRGVRSTYNNGVLIGSTRYYENQDGDCSGNNNCTTNTKWDAYEYGSVLDNFDGGYTFLMSLIPVATYGDNPDAANYLAAFKDKMNNLVIPPLSDPLRDKGGDTPEGWSYASSFHRTLMGLFGYYTATGDPIFDTFVWPKELAEAMIHRSQSDLLNIGIYGDWSGTPLGVNRSYLAYPIMRIAQELYPTDTISEVGQYLVANAGFTDPADYWYKAFWYNSGFPQQSPSVLPLSHREIGHGLYSSRSSWTNANDTVFVWSRLEGKLRNTREGYDEGDIGLMRGPDRLLTQKATAYNATDSNTVVFLDMNHHAFNPDLTETAIDRYEEGTQYSYVSANLTNAWKRQWNIDRINLFRRSILHLRPGIVVVYDVTQSNLAYSASMFKEWYTHYEVDPNTTADTISATIGNSKVFVKTLYPAGGTFTKSGPSSGIYAVKYTPAVQQEYDQFLHVVEATGAGQAKMVSNALVSSAGGNARGTYISDDTRESANWLAMFTADQDGQAVSTDIVYTLPGGKKYQPRHFFADLPPGSTWTFVAPANRLVQQTFKLLAGSFPGQGKVVTASDHGTILIQPKPPVEVPVN